MAEPLSTSSNDLFVGTVDRYKGVHIKSVQTPCDVSSFKIKLECKLYLQALLFFTFQHVGPHERIHTMLHRNKFVRNLDESASQRLLGIMSRQWVGSLARSWGRIQYSIDMLQLWQGAGSGCNSSSNLADTWYHVLKLQTLHLNGF